MTDRNITVPKELEQHIEKVLKEMNIDFEKVQGKMGPLTSSALWPEKRDDEKAEYTMYRLSINETLSFYAGMMVKDAILQTLHTL